VSRYAEGTSVSVAQSRAELETTLTRYGASSFASMIQSGKAAVMFEASGRRVLFELPLPKREDFAQETQVYHRGGAPRSKLVEVPPHLQEKKWEQACRQRWRALNLVVKAKLEAVETGITTFEDEFLAHIVLPDGKTVGKWMRPQLQKTYESGKMPPMLAIGSGT
jgi:hypothetical protein